ncbi:MAG TPA: hypothetical protein PLJ43_01355 [Chitinophagales bacterium]|nr:hypothetical protein [Chitinophagales bacterium]HNA56728.1 hypothetical protein [Chitinophagales bacterium]
MKPKMKEKRVQSRIRQIANLSAMRPPDANLELPPAELLKKRRVIYFWRDMHNMALFINMSRGDSAE